MIRKFLDLGLQPLANKYLTKKDLIRKKLNKNNKSYWIKREKPIGTMKKQF